MFRLFNTRCPIELELKAWVEWRWCWLGEQFGWQAMLDTEVYLPQTLPGFGKRHLSTSDAKEIFHFISKSFPINAEQVELSVTPDHMMPERSVGLYEKRKNNSKGNVQRSVVHIRESELKDFGSTVSTLAHELAHEALLGNDLMSVETKDHECLTDLLPLYFGYGLFLANNTVREFNWTDGRTAFSTSTKKGYLSSIAFGHALALFCWLRNEPKPAWHSMLRADAGKTMAASLRYFKKTNDSLVMPNNLTDRNQRKRDTRLDVNSDSPTRRLAALWDLKPNSDSAVLATQLLRDKETPIQMESLKFFCSLDHLPEGAVPILQSLMLDADPSSQERVIWILIRHQKISRDLMDTVVFLITHGRSRYSPQFADAIGWLLAVDKSILDDERAVNAIVDAAVKGVWCEYDESNESDSAFAMEGINELGIAIRPALRAIDRLPKILQQRFSQLDKKVVQIVLDLAKSEPDAKA